MTTDSEKKLLIAGDEKGNIYFYDLISGKQIQKVSVHAAAVTQLRFNSNGKLLISATADGEIKIFDFEKNKVVQAIYSPEYSGIGFVLFSIADGFIYFNGNNKTVWVMIQGLVQTLLVRLPLAYYMSIQPNASLTKIGLAAPVATVTGIILNVGFFIYLNRKEKAVTSPSS